jgi:hypothetical protein
MPAKWSRRALAPKSIWVTFGITCSPSWPADPTGSMSSMGGMTSIRSKPSAVRTLVRYHIVRYRIAVPLTIGHDGCAGAPHTPLFDTPAPPSPAGDRRIRPGIRRSVSDPTERSTPSRMWPGQQNHHQRGSASNGQLTFAAACVDVVQREQETGPG